MCGLIGMAGEITVKEERALKTLLTLDALRGIDSTGIAVVPRHQGMVKMAKEVGNPYELFNTKSYDKALMGTHRAIIGHNRFATQGATTRRNAHPFEFDTLVGAHNGTLKNKYRLDDNKDFDVDSENLYHHMDKHGVRDALDIIEGAWALTWWDKLDESINFLRNEERPLFIARSKDTKVLFWASESWMIRIATSREGIEIEDPFLLDVNMLVSFNVHKNGTLEKPSATPMAAKAPAPFYNKWNPPPKDTTTPATPKLTVVAETKGTESSSTTVSTPLVTTPVVKPILTLSKSIDEKKVDEKNSRVAPTTAKQRTISGLKKGYEHSKNASLEVSGYGTDSFGACYYILADVEAPDVRVRLYYTASKVKQRSPVGTKITADIGELRCTVADGAFYKVVASSVRLVEESKTNTYVNSKGNRVDFNTWMNQHSSCCWCADNVTPMEAHKFSPGGELLCKDCIEITEIKSMYGWE